MTAEDIFYIWRWILMGVEVLLSRSGLDKE